MITVYIAGKITGDPEYKAKFAEAQQSLEAKGYIVVNPAIFPLRGFTYEQYVRMGIALLNECETICLLPDWKDSEGAKFELEYAYIMGKEVMHYEAGSD